LPGNISALSVLPDSDYSIKQCPYKSNNIMRRWFRRLLAPPIFIGDEDKTRAAWLVHTIIWAIIASALLFRTITWFTTQRPPVSLLLLLVIILTGTLFIVHLGQIRLASIITVLSVWLTLTVQALFNSGIRATGFRFYIFAVLIAGLLLGRKAALATAGVSILTGIGFWYAERSGFMSSQPPTLTLIDALVLQSLGLLLAAVLVTLATSRIEVALARVRAELDERKRLEEINRERQRQHEALVESIDGIVWEADASTFNFTFVSHQAETILGYPVEKWLTDPNFWISHVHVDDRDWAIAFCAAATERKENHQFDYRMMAADGRVVWLRDIVTVSQMEDHTFRLRGVMIDITERVQAEEALRFSESRYRKIVEAAPEAIVVLDVATGKFIDFNPQALALFKLSAEAIRNVGPVELSPPLQPDGRASSEAAKDYLQRALSGQIPVFEWVHYDAQNMVVPCEVRLLQLPDESRQLVRGTITDITERKQMEEQLKTSAEQLRALTASLRSAREEEGRRIAREIHDELGASLTSLRWELERFNKVLSKTGEQVKLDGWRERVTTMLELTKTTMRGLLRIAAELRPSVLDDLGLVEALEWQTKEFATRTGIRCQLHAELETLALNLEQSTALFRIFQEALSNVQRHAQATEVEVVLQEAAAEIVLTISDNGCGITAAQQSNPSALGLLGMRERAHLIGAQITFTGIEGKGTVVSVRVPTTFTPTD
jgi:PAS domain S-box-containing protein